MRCPPRHSLIAYTSGHLFHQRQGDYLCDWLLPLGPAHAVDSQIPFFRIAPTVLTGYIRVSGRKSDRNKEELFPDDNPPPSTGSKRDHF